MWYNGLLDLSVMQLILVMLVLTHITIVSVTLYLHRHSAHNSLDLHPVLAHFFRFWVSARCCCRVPSFMNRPAPKKPCSVTVSALPRTGSSATCTAATRCWES